MVNAFVIGVLFYSYFHIVIRYNVTDIMMLSFSITLVIHVPLLLFVMNRIIIIVIVIVLCIGVTLDKFLTSLIIDSFLFSLYHCYHYHQQMHSYYLSLHIFIMVITIVPLIPPNELFSINIYDISLLRLSLSTH